MTLRQKKLAINLGKSRTLQEAMLKSDYSKSTAHQQTNITKSKSWQKLLEEKLPDSELLQVTKDALKAQREDLPDHPTRLRAAEQGYKLKGKLTTDNSINIDKAIVMPILGGKTKE